MKTNVCSSYAAPTTKVVNVRIRKAILGASPMSVGNYIDDDSRFGEFERESER